LLIATPACRWIRGQPVNIERFGGAAICIAYSTREAMLPEQLVQSFQQTVTFLDSQLAQAPVPGMRRSGAVGNCYLAWAPGFSAVPALVKMADKIMRPEFAPLGSELRRFGSGVREQFRHSCVSR
jgi:hypothetical protein